jgi:hypothetical protein
MSVTFSGWPVGRVTGRELGSGCVRMGLPEHADRLRERARREVFAAHPSELPRLQDRLGVVLTGDSALV